MDFRNKVRMSFFNVKRDMYMLKQQVHDWISYLNNGQRRLETRIAELENKLAQLETGQRKEIVIK